MQQNEFDELKGIIYRAATNEPFDDRFDNVSENGKFLIRQLEKARKYDKAMSIGIKEGWFTTKECGGFVVSEEDLKKSGIDKYGSKIK